MGVRQLHVEGDRIPHDGERILIHKGVKVLYATVDIRDLVVATVRDVIHVGHRVRNVARSATTSLYLLLP